MSQPPKPTALSAKHPNSIGPFEGSLDDLAARIGDLRYDALAHFLAQLSAKLASDGDKDAARGRRKLADSLARASAITGEAAAEVERTWRICAPYMPEAPQPSPARDRKS